MSIKKMDDSRYKVDLRPHGISGRRIQRVFNKKADAIAFERHVVMTSNNDVWRPQSRDYRTLAELFNIWWEYEGKALTYAEKRRTALLTLIKDMGNPYAYKFDNRFIHEYRSKRLHSGVKASTINRDLTMLSSMFTCLINIGEYKSSHPVRVVKPLKEVKPEMSYLSNNEIDSLLKATSGDAHRITALCLCTGARWGEATALRAEQVRNNRVTFTVTKNGRHRTVPVSDEVINLIKVKESGLLFHVDYGDYRETLKRIKPDLPKGQAVHVLRHTFAAHFMMNGGNILTLQRILGHATIQQTMTYAHLSPDFLQEAIKFNPIAGMAAKVLQQ